jgi:hypothetical protein
MMDIRTNFVEAVKFFRECRNELSVRIKGGVYVNPLNKEEVVYEGIGIEAKIENVLRRSTLVKESFLALRDAEVYLNRVHEVWYDAKLIRAELKALINNKDLIKDTRYSDTARDLKEVYNKVCDYHEICEQKYKHLQEILFGLVQVNSSINRRYFGDPDYMFNYESKDD